MTDDIKAPEGFETGFFKIGFEDFGHGPSLVISQCDEKWNELHLETEWLSPPQNVAIHHNLKASGNKAIQLILRANPGYTTIQPYIPMPLPPLPIGPLLKYENISPFSPFDFIVQQKDTVPQKDLVSPPPISFEEPKPNFSFDKALDQAMKEDIWDRLKK